jgi:hypothetical protein
MTARFPLFVAAAVVFMAAICLTVVLARRATGDLAAVAREDARREPLDRNLAAVRRLSEDKHRVVADLIAGRVTLREAAGRFRELNATPVEDSNGREVVPPFRAFAGEEALWRSVCFWVEVELGQQREPSAAGVRARLRAEFREQFGHDPEEFSESRRPPTSANCVASRQPGRYNRGCLRPS